jgi:protein-disulfide isomerase
VIAPFVARTNLQGNDMPSIFKFFATACMILLPAFANAQNLSRDEVRDIAIEAVKNNPALVLEIILDNPDVIMEAVAILRARDEAAAKEQAAATLSAQSNTLFNDPNAFVLGNPEGDVTLVEFFDYNCGYCKKAFNVMQELIAEDPELRVVFREWPILSEASVFATRASLAAREQDKYEEFHWALMAGNGARSENGVMAVAAEVGLDIAQLKEDMQKTSVDAHISLSREMAQSLGFSGTPSFVVGNQLVPGYVEKAGMVEMIAEARAESQ